MDQAVYMCVCARERERERERLLCCTKEINFMLVFAWKCIKEIHELFYALIGSTKTFS
ncbi:hypothetical protein MUK42_36348 [Musa troglodytarum]|uniref:Uncharacterized protein n=1 Tax=Musa troglodytarum TaxID=320322 RepID=A0A9E7KMC3_9LILI|nr:hypothetical protein MUK42_36348 [Musa troglodytarum]